MADVFLSYAREDLNLAAKLAQLLEANGLSVWWDRRLIAGDQINATIERAIEEAKAIVVLWSPSAVASRWVNGEAETAAEAGKLVPVKIAECKLPLNFRSLHTPDVFRSRDQLSELAAMLTAKLNPGARPAENIVITAASADTFLSGLKAVMNEQSPDFFEQMRREWALCRRHPVASVLSVATFYGAAYAFAEAAELDFTFVSNLALAAFAIIYFAFRSYRLKALRGT